MKFIVENSKQQYRKEDGTWTDNAEEAERMDQIDALVLIGELANETGEIHYAQSVVC